MPKINFRHAKGFTLIEVLVSMFILAIGLLGLASLQGISLKNNQDAYLYSQANALAYEMSDRIKANRLGWAAIPAAPANDCATGCDSAAASCTTSQMADSDYCYWLQKATAMLSPDATVVITASPKAGSTACTGNNPPTTPSSPTTRCLTMTWSRTNQSLSAPMNTTNYELEVTP